MLNHVHLPHNIPEIRTILLSNISILFTRWSSYQHFIRRLDQDLGLLSFPRTVTPPQPSEEENESHPVALTPFSQLINT